MHCLAIEEGHTPHQQPVVHVEKHAQHTATVLPTAATAVHDSAIVVATAAAVTVTDSAAGAADEQRTAAAAVQRPL